MSKSKTFFDKKKQGEQGEKIVLEAVRNTNCFLNKERKYLEAILPYSYSAQCKGRQTWEKQDSEFYRKAKDIDFKVKFSCEGCPYAKGATSAVQEHEIKTNIKTHIDIRSQNMVVELIENVFNYNDKKVDRYIDEQTGEVCDVRRGIGWYYKNGDKIPDWYHFYQPLEWHQPLERESYPIDEALTATPDELTRWRNDKAVPPGSLLLMHYPPSYVISIEGKHFHEMVEKCRSDSRRYPVIECGLQELLLIPIRDIVPCRDFDKAGRAIVEQTARPAPFYDMAKVRITIASTVPDGKPILAKRHTEGDRGLVYVPRRILDTVCKQSSTDLHTMSILKPISAFCKGKIYSVPEYVHNLLFRVLA